MNPLSKALTALRAANQIIAQQADEMARIENSRIGLKWTKDLPTEPGYYWDRMLFPGVSPTISHVSRRLDGVLILDDNGELELYRGREWAGPIPPPEGYAP